ncbi:MAG: class II fructose-bisphosphatase [Anaerolineales bacterium]
MSNRPERNLAMELVRVTEAAALAAGRWMGRGQKVDGDRAAVEAMRLILGTVEMNGVVVIGEGEKDQAPMLYNGELVGNGRPPAVDVAVDPVEGTNLLALGRPNAIAVIALAERWSMWNPGPSLYMEKLVVGKQARDVIDIDCSPEENLHRIAEALERPIHELTVFMLDKPRHSELIRTVREAGARVTLQTDGDVAGALLACTPNSGVDVLMGIGGTPEGVIAAAAVKALGGAMRGRRAPQSAAEQERVIAALGETWQEVLTQDDLIRSEDVFFAATGITDGALLRGVHYTGEGASTDSLVIRGKTGTVRTIHAEHRWDKLKRISQVAY